MKTSTSNYWNKIGESYASAWSYNGRQYVSDQELQFLKNSIKKYLTKKEHAVKALDLGCGAGRILSALENVKTIDTLMGIDFSDEMLLYCKQRFINSKKIKKLIHHDISKKLPFQNETFDAVTSFRAVKYNMNWKDIIKECERILKKGGIFIFDMPNINSINRLSNIEVAIHKTTLKELKQTLEKTGFEIMEIKGGPILPGFLYDTIKGPILNGAISGEKFFKIIFGEIFLSRFIYIACRKI
ncbi:MAG: class I SAM-dependent methyltransferase [Candidatus Levyibacteriota bacterium]